MAEPRARAGMTLARLIAGGPEGRESAFHRGDAHPVRSLGLFRTLSLPLSHMLLVRRRQLAPRLLCRPGDIYGLESLKGFVSVEGQAPGECGRYA